jgi:hypothetical protein
MPVKFTLKDDILGREPNGREVKIITILKNSVRYLSFVYKEQPTQSDYDFYLNYQKDILNMKPKIFYEWKFLNGKLHKTGKEMKNIDHISFHPNNRGNPETLIRLHFDETAKDPEELYGPHNNSNSIGLVSWVLIDRTDSKKITTVSLQKHFDKKYRESFMLDSYSQKKDEILKEISLRVEKNEMDYKDGKLRYHKYFKNKRNCNKIKNQLNKKLNFQYVQNQALKHHQFFDICDGKYTLIAIDDFQSKEIFLDFLNGIPNTSILILGSMGYAQSHELDNQKNKIWIGVF